MQVDPHDPWERLLVAGLARDFQTMRLDFLRRHAAKKPLEDAQTWLQANAVRVSVFKAMVDRARMTGVPTPAMLAQVARQARGLLGRYRFSFWGLSLLGCPSPKGLMRFAF